MTLKTMKNSENYTSCYKIFQELKIQERAPNQYISVDSVPSSKFHKIGISNEGYPIFFVKCNDTNKAIDIKLELVSVLFSKDCNIKEGATITNSKFAIILLKTLNMELQKYFTDVFSIILNKIADIPSERELNSEVRKVIDLFSNITKPALKSIQGLWAELLVIEKSFNPEYLIQSWHVSAQDKYDFNDSIDKIEVKSTSKANRIHSFSIEQLNCNPGSGLLVISILALESGKGKSIFDLKESISHKINNLELEVKLNELIYNTLRSDYENANSIYFDYQYAVDSILAFDVIDIPKLLTNTIPQGVLNVKFDVNFANLTDVKTNGNNLDLSQLFRSLNL